MFHENAYDRAEMECREERLEKSLVLFEEAQCKLEESAKNDEEIKKNENIRILMVKLKVSQELEN